MPSADETIDALRNAVRISPENLPLRQALAETLMAHARYDEAEREYKAALALAPQDKPIKLALAAAYYQQEKNSHAMVIVEDLIKGAGSGGLPAKALVLHAKLLLRAGETEYAVRQYKRGVEADASAADTAFAARLGIPSSYDPTRPSDELFEGKLRTGAGEGEGEEIAKI